MKRTPIANPIDLDSPLARFARAGDAFHYRWAARRCLKLIDFQSGVGSITIESSKESKARGEYVIDLAEYSEKSGRKLVNYCQLKHSTVRTTKPFSYSEIKGTLAGFAGRFRHCLANHKLGYAEGTITFSFVSNRPISSRIKEAVNRIRAGLPAKGQLQKQIQGVTKLKGDKLRSFFQSVVILDSEADYLVQRTTLQGEMTEYLAGFVDSHETDNLISLVALRALPKPEAGRKTGEIRREDVLNRFNITSAKYLFPAPIQLEVLSQAIEREQHKGILQFILRDENPCLIHAAGGVGKSVITRQISESLPAGSLAVIYDCFGSGTYRNPSEPRHRPQDALVQISNELAAKGLCRTLVCRPGTQPDSLFDGFNERLRQAIQKLREVTPNAVIVLLIDAADNAEMVASELNERCFAKALLREKLPGGCHLVMLCRTERRDLLTPASNVRQFPLADFSRAESAAHLRTRFPSASNHDVLEFHRLSGGNPRVQANALKLPGGDLAAILTNLGPTRTTVDDQIYQQLQTAVDGIKDRLGPGFQNQAQAICQGLANLPPFIPIPVLAKAAGVDAASIKSFISDLGRPLWHSDDSVQFRDEPTESWFRRTFSASKNQIAHYVSVLEPLAGKFSYVSKVLPQLLMQSEQYQRLFDLALSDDLLPEDNPVDARNITVYRLQYAFRAALKLDKIADAARLALRAGEEVAGDQRQIEVIKSNIDLIAPLQSPSRVEELAHRQVIAADWDGSQNLYSAALLSSVKDFHGEAQGFLRASHRWLQIYFETRDEYRKTHPSHFQAPQYLTNAHLAEFAWSHYNLYGPERAAKYVMSWRPAGVIFEITRMFVHCLITAGQFEQINQFARAGAKNPHLILAVADKLSSLASIPPKETLLPTLEFLTDPQKRIDKPGYISHDDPVPGAILSFLEACAQAGLDKQKIQQALEFYAETDAARNISGHFSKNSRAAFFRNAALRSVLKGEFSPKPSSLLPPVDPQKQHGPGADHEALELSRIADCFFPWYMLRARFILLDPDANNVDLAKLFASAEVDLERNYHEKKLINLEIGSLHFQVLALKKAASEADLQWFIQNVARKIKPKMSLIDSLHATFVAFRLPHLSGLRAHLEATCREAVQAPGIDGPESRAQSFIDLARAVLPASVADAAAYFNFAIEAVSKFGDEMIQRWGAVVAIAKQAGQGDKHLPQLCYRFVRCAEMIGETVDREKYWNRNEVFRAAIHLDCSGTFAALSRWRDRDVGAFDVQLPALTQEAVASGMLEPIAGWCLSAFEGCNANLEFAAVCIAKEQNPAKQQRLLNASIRDALLADARSEDWEELRELAQKLKLNFEGAPSPIQAARPVPPTIAPGSGSSIKPFADPNWDDLFKGVNLLTHEGLNLVLSPISEPDFETPVEDVWTQLISRIPSGKEAEFLDVIVTHESIRLHDLERIVVLVAHDWSHKVSVKRRFPAFLKKLGQRFAGQLAVDYHLPSWVDNRFLTVSEADMVRNAAFAALADSHDSIDAETFFGFAEHFARRLTQPEAEELLAFALGRFELHIPDNFGDGKWEDALKTDSGSLVGMTGLIWSALGSPYSSQRWQAAHCVRRLGENSCQQHIDQLMACMATGSVGAFGAPSFPFYELHAKLYLLIALARLATDDARILKKHAQSFARIALEELPHLLIQTTAAQIALAVDAQYSGTFSTATVRKLKAVGKSPYPPKIVKNNAHSRSTPWHTSGTINTSLRLHFGWDFDRYWFEPLAQLFGVPTDQVTELARDIAVNELKVPESDGYSRDPRQPQWNALDHSGKTWTWHSHGDYPRIDTYDFYYSYHSLLIAGAKLVSKMPVIHETGYGAEADELAAWSRWHRLARPDGRWLADRRDPAPKTRRAWCKSMVANDWLWEVNRDDFFDCLVNQCTLPNFVCVDGDWTDHSGSFMESISVSSVLVNPESANALASALRTADDTYSLHFLHHHHHDMDFSVSPFDLTTWTRLPGESTGRLDGFDPYGKDINYPQYDLQKPFQDLLKLASDPEKRRWTKRGRSEPSVVAEVWSDKETPGSRNWEEPYRSGSRISASVSLLKELCVKSGKSLVLAVHIRRSELRRNHSTDDRDLGYLPPSHKVFIFTPNGTLQDVSKDHQLG